MPLIACVVFGLAVIFAPLRSGGWLWDSANAIGFLTFIFMLYLFLDVGRGARAKLHQYLGYALVFGLFCHIVLLVALDPTLWHYLNFQSPHYMFAGIASTIFCLAIVAFAWPSGRRYWHPNHVAFKRWHSGLSLSALATALWHMTGSSFYLEPLAAALLIAFSLTVFGITRQKKITPSFTLKPHMFFVFALAVSFVVFKNSP